MQSLGEENSPSGAQTLPKTAQQSWWQSIFFIVLAAFILRLAVITIGHTYRITPRRDHFQFGWEMGRIARSIALGQGFSSPTDLPTGPSAWAPDRKSTRLNSSHMSISYAVFCLKKKK